MAPIPRDREGKPLDAYYPANIVLLPRHEFIRRRPGIYLGSVDSRALHELVEICLREPLEQTRTGAVRQIEVELLGDGSCRVSDDGPGLPVERDPQRDNLTTVELRLTSDGGGGLHGLNYPVVNALSERLVVEVARDGFFWRQEFRRGERTTDLQRGEPTSTTGTSITFWPDPTIFPGVRFDGDRLRERLRELAFVNSGLIIRWIDSR
jgi:DNA gyrase subunit B